MKIYILIEKVFPQCTPNCEILGAYKDIEEARKALNFIANNNLKNYGFVVRDEDKNKQFTNYAIIYYGYQENWDNYIEYIIVEKEVL